MFNVKTIEQVTNTESKKKQIMENWNKYQYVVLSHNCYAFVMNKLDVPGLIECKDKNNCSKPQPGLASATKIEYYKGDRLSCENIMKRVIKDSHNTIYIPKHEPEKMINIEKKIIYRKAHDCKKGYYKGVLVIAPGEDYHFYREVSKNVWLHKRGQTKVIDTDASGKPITDPQLADRNYGPSNNYSVFCTYFCIPIDNSKRNVSASKINKNSLKDVYNTSVNVIKKYIQQNKLPLDINTITSINFNKNIHKKISRHNNTRKNHSRNNNTRKNNNNSRRNN